MATSGLPGSSTPSRRPNRRPVTRSSGAPAGVSTNARTTVSRGLQQGLGVVPVLRALVDLERAQRDRVAEAGARDQRGELDRVAGDRHRAAAVDVRAVVRAQLDAVAAVLDADTEKRSMPPALAGHRGSRSGPSFVVPSVDMHSTDWCPSGTAAARPSRPIAVARVGSALALLHALDLRDDPVERLLGVDHRARDLDLRVPLENCTTVIATEPSSGTFAGSRSAVENPSRCSRQSARRCCRTRRSRARCRCGRRGRGRGDQPQDHQPHAEQQLPCHPVPIVKPRSLMRSSMRPPAGTDSSRQVCGDGRCRFAGRGADGSRLPRLPGGLIPGRDHVVAVRSAAGYVPDVEAGPPREGVGCASVTKTAADPTVTARLRFAVESGRAVVCVSPIGSPRRRHPSPQTCLEESVPAGGRIELRFSDLGLTMGTDDRKFLVCALLVALGLVVPATASAAKSTSGSSSTAPAASTTPTGSCSGRASRPRCATRRTCRSTARWRSRSCSSQRDAGRGPAHGDRLQGEARQASSRRSRAWSSAARRTDPDAGSRPASRR